MTVRRAAVLFIVVFVLIVFSALLVTNTMSVVQRIARVSNVRGAVELQPVGQDAFVPVTADRNARAGSILRTGKGGHATLRWPDGTALRVSPNTTLTIDKCTFDKRSDVSLSHFTLSAGRVWVNVIKMLSAESKFEISTPTATAGVRGTSFAIEVSPGATDVLVYEGEVEVRAGEQSIGVKGGQTLAVTESGNTALRELDERERAEAQEALAELPAPTDRTAESGPPPSG
ncbi:MAG: FecR domain-containing protein, partial [Armatimonadetes bacterium]|nr:FecR domain-containing protein [Armatimonadota bacterium]